MTTHKANQDQHPVEAAGQQKQKKLQQQAFEKLAVVEAEENQQEQDEQIQIWQQGIRVQ